ncbi:MAG: GNAT family N-acetyltransferase [Bdellovibrionota bacterium]
MSLSNAKLNAAIYAAIDAPILPEGTQVIRDEGWYQLMNPGLKEASANEVMLSLLTDSMVDRRVEEVFTGYRKHQLPFKWAIGPMSSPDRLEKKIAPLASASWEFSGMVIDTDSDFSTSADVEIELVTEKNFPSFLEVNLEGWDLGAFAEQTKAKLSKVVSHPHYRCFIALKSGKAIGSAATVLKEGYGNLIGAVVLNQFRGCGAYKKLIHARLADLQRSGVSFAVTQARAATSAPILEKMGFESAYTAKIYRFDP